MRRIIDPGKERRSINFLDNIRYSQVRDLQGEPVDLMLSLMVQNGNSEMRLASGRDDEVSTGLQPVIVWINGAGWRACDKNLMSAEMEFLAEAGYAVAFIQYRNSSQGHFPAQLVDVKTAIRFLRTHAEAYHLDPKRIGTIGRSAGGHLSAFCAMNLPGYDQGEWLQQGSEVQAAVDLFGPVDITALYDLNQPKLKDPSYRWHRESETHEGALLGGDEATMRERSFAASPVRFINKGMCPLAILHGDQDVLVPSSVSEDFYRRLVEAGLEGRSELYILKNAGHGTREFFQQSTKSLIVAFFDEHLAGGEACL